MSEPAEIADHAEEVAPGLWHWRISNSAIGGAISSSHAVAAGDGCVLVDPVRLEPLALPPPVAIVLTATTHQRSSWRYRDELGIEVWLPEDARAGDEEPDVRYAEGDVLPGALLAFRTPGPEQAHYSFLLERDPGVLFCSDLLLNDGDRDLAFVPPEFHEDPDETRRSVEKLLDLPFAILCLDHGAPIVDDPKSAIRDLLDATA
ncbi:MAG TPA: MBL fold metallo-hydrolase [Gaiellaceae bacterium]|nr:MBL fold metallo-hydrolase [Gaiellaceae bacterium]